MVNGWRVWRRRGSLTAGGPAGVSGSTWGCGYWRGCRRSQQGKEAFLVPLGFIWLLAIPQGPSAHRHLKLNYSSVVCKWSVIHNSHQCTCITLILLYSKGFPVEFCSSKALQMETSICQLSLRDATQVIRWQQVLARLQTWMRLNHRGSGGWPSIWNQTQWGLPINPLMKGVS